jgi:L-ascorbate metabolism protein UlaG (beta-lactamase superfamily)
MPALELWWLGQSGFRLRSPDDSGPTVFVDPYLLQSERRSWHAPAAPADLAGADLVLSTHEHTDHFDRPSLEAAAHAPDARFTLVVPRPIVDEAVALGLPRERVIGAQPDEVIERAGVRIHPLPARHGVNVSDAYNFGEDLSGGLTRYLGYVVEMNGVRVYHAGDCIPYEGQIERLKALRPHVALLPINGRDYYRETERNVVGNVDEREAAKVASDVGVEVLVPMHWELFAHNRGYPGDLLGFVADNYPNLTVLVLGRGAHFTFTPSQA